MNQHGLRLWRLALGAWLVTGCALWAADTSAPNPDASLSAPKPAEMAAWQQRFTLGAGDVLNFSLVGSPELARQGVVVGPDGRISYLQAQDVEASGLTIDELRAKFDQVLSKYYRSPHTIITPVAYNSKKYIVLGAVAQKGVFLYDRPLTVIEAIGRAGGFTVAQSAQGVRDLADLQRSFLIRDSARVPVDFQKLFEQGDLTQNAPLQPGDFLYFPPVSLREVYVLGAVQGPGTLPYQPNMTAVAAITSRGGFTDRAWRDKVLVVRGSLKHPATFVLNMKAILTARAPDFKLEPKDVIYVSERPWVEAEDLVNMAVTAFANAALIQYTGENVRLLHSTSQ